MIMQGMVKMHEACMRGAPPTAGGGPALPPARAIKGAPTTVLTKLSLPGGKVATFFLSRVRRPRGRVFAMARTRLEERRRVPSRRRRGIVAAASLRRRGGLVASSRRRRRGLAASSRRRRGGLVASSRRHRGGIAAAFAAEPRRVAAQVDEDATDAARYAPDHSSRAPPRRKVADVAGLAGAAVRLLSVAGNNLAPASAAALDGRGLAARFAWTASGLDWSFAVAFELGASTIAVASAELTVTACS